jgi:hypothetical protein
MLEMGMAHFNHHRRRGRSRHQGFLTAGKALGVLDGGALVIGRLADTTADVLIGNAAGQLLERPPHGFRGSVERPSGLVGMAVLDLPTSAH